MASWPLALRICKRERWFSVDPKQLATMFVNGFCRFYVESGTRFWSRKTLEGVLRDSGVPEGLDSPLLQSILKDLESKGYIKLLYGDDRYLEVFDIDKIEMEKKK